MVAVFVFLYACIRLLRRIKVITRLRSKVRVFKGANNIDSLLATLQQCTCGFSSLCLIIQYLLLITVSLYAILWRDLETVLRMHARLLSYALNSYLVTYWESRERQIPDTRKAHRVGCWLPALTGLVVACRARHVLLCGRVPSPVAPTAAAAAAAAADVSDVVRLVARSIIHVRSLWCSTVQQLVTYCPLLLSARHLVSVLDASHRLRLRVSAFSQQRDLSSRSRLLLVDTKLRCLGDDWRK